ncbi:helix-turn-helix transcriptional regulator [Pseudomonas proteolytica]|uniref:LuxR C-terminal-related transcriptional regulator n=1 Tax=Pseudomonas proteolytica TaxID=219574 RepID=UPI001472F9FF|nr:LuxR C-terminal-related transcriptional regulator [Pseudomonas proteolytica]NMZ09074.1 helix-turn-helix transcriptional regulator [Pseudomonas proteolytica]
MNSATSITVGTWQGFLGRGLALRELECVLGLALGKTSKQLAKDMGIEAESVKKRVLSASTKLGVRLRAQLVAEAMRRQIIAPSVMALIALLTTHAVLGDNEMLRVRRGSGERRVELRMTARRVEGYAIT